MRPVDACATTDPCFVCELQFADESFETESLTTLPPKMMCTASSIQGKRLE